MAKMTDAYDLPARLVSAVPQQIVSTHYAKVVKLSWSVDRIRSFF